MSLDSYNGLSALWMEAFDDDPTGTSLFFDMLYRPKNTPVIEADGKPVSAVYLVDITLSLPDNKVADAYYFCGASTLKEYRSRGYVTELIERAKKMTVERGKEYIVLIPANDGLYSFYEKRGFQTLFYVNDKTFTCSESGHSEFVFRDITDVSVMTHFQNAAAKKIPYSVMKTPEICSYTLGETALYGGRTLGIIKDGEYKGCMVYYPDENLIRDLSVTEFSNEEIIDSFMNVFSLKTVEAVLPAESENGARKKGMIWSVNGRIPQTDKIPFINLLLEEK